MTPCLPDHEANNTVSRCGDGIHRPIWLKLVFASGLTMAFGSGDQLDEGAAVPPEHGVLELKLDGYARRWFRVWDTSRPSAP